MVLEPRPIVFFERQVALGRIDDFGTGVDARLGGVGFDQRLGKTVDGRAEQLIEGFSGLPEVLKLVGRDAFGERTLDVRRDFSVGQFVHEPLDADAQLAGGELGESDCRDVLGLDTLGQEDGHPAGHDGCLPGTGPGFHQEGPVDLGESGRAGDLVRERQFFHHFSSQILMASPMR